MNPSASPSQVVDAFLAKDPDDLREYIQRFYNYYEVLASLSTDREMIADAGVTPEEQEEARSGDEEGKGKEKVNGKGRANGKGTNGRGRGSTGRSGNHRSGISPIRI